MPSTSVIKLLSNPRIPINALAYGSGINRNSRVANQLNNLASGINYYIMRFFISFKTNVQFSVSSEPGRTFVLERYTHHSLPLLKDMRWYHQV